MLKIKALLMSSLLLLSLSSLSGCMDIEKSGDKDKSETSEAATTETTVTTTSTTTTTSARKEKPTATTEEEELPTYSAIEIYQESGAFPDGTYAIGTEMPEGIYLFQALETGHGVQGVYADPECSTQISAAYVHFDGSRIVEIKGNGYVDYSWCMAYDLSKHPELVNDPRKGSGMFVVGRDIEPGTYTLIPDEGEYGDYAEWKIYSSINAVAPIIISSGSAMREDDMTITLNEGEYLETTYCRVK